MADYSGAWHCSECGATGTAYQGSHLPWCSVTETLARIAREKRERDMAELSRKAAIYAEWSAMSDDDVVRTIREVRQKKGDLHEQLKPLDELEKVGLDVVRERRLVDRVLERDWA